MPGRRFVLLHYHLFKNAGTSVDAILKANFGAAWHDIEFRPPGQQDHGAAIREFIVVHDRLAAVSSHTLCCPPPRGGEFDVFPIVFVRHPLERLRSAYDFERTQQADTVGARLAKLVDFSGYLRTRLGIEGDRSCRNFQAFRLAAMVSEAGGTERSCALAALDTLPFVGLVEAFPDSIRHLTRLLKPRLPAFRGFDVWKNATARYGSQHPPGGTPVWQDLDAETCALALAANESDMEVFDTMRGRYSAASLSQASA